MVADSAFLAHVEAHVRDFFTDHEITEHTFSQGPTKQLIPEFRVLCAHPNSQFNFWTYLSVGTSFVEHEEGQCLEFLITSSSQDQLWVELLTMTAFYHSTERLGLGHTFPIGHPALTETSCDHMLVSLPYPFGPDLEVCCLNHSHVQFLWLLPITAAEKCYRMEHGLEALELKFDEHEIDFLNLKRPSVVPETTT